MNYPCLDYLLIAVSLEVAAVFDCITSLISDAESVLRKIVPSNFFNRTIFFNKLNL